jgi:hypothetical protein
VPGIAAQRRGWPHRVRGNGGDALHWSDVTVSSRTGAGLKSVPLLSVLSSSLERRDVEVIQEWAAQCHGVDTGLTAQLPYNARDGLTGRVGGIALGYDSQTVLEDRRGGESPLTWEPAVCQSI